MQSSRSFNLSHVSPRVQAPTSTKFSATLPILLWPLLPNASATSFEESEPGRNTKLQALSFSDDDRHGEGSGLC